MEKLRHIVNSNDTVEGKIFDWVIQLVILISLISFSLDTLPNLSIKSKTLLYYVEVTTVVIFCTEYLLRLICAPKKVKFIFSFYGLIDLIAIVPFFVTTGLDLRSIRALRFMRLFRTLKFVRYNSALQRIFTALRLAREEFILFFSLTCILLFISAVGIYYFENHAQPENFSSIFDGLWWAVATLTTVGYGDIYPVTIGGKIFTFFILMIGLGIVAVPAAIFSSALSKAREIVNN
ncbi:MAG: ion transporter [Fulvivirga sp.]